MTSPAKTCYVSMPFGKKTDPWTGRTIDFDEIYRTLLKPAVEAAGLVTSRADELESAVVFLRPILTAILGSDVMVADISTANPNVLYELGIRHALRRNITVLVMESGTQMPSNLSLARVLTYQLDAAGQLVSEQPIRQALTDVIREGLTRVTTDSPVFEFFSDLTVQLPPELSRATGRGGGSGLPRAGRTAAEGVVAAAKDPAEALRHAEAELRQTADADPYAYITLLRRYRDLSAWDDVIRVADSIPPHLASAPEVVQILALALNRRRQPGDQERALVIVRSLIQETGGDGESYGILGRIYKDRYEECRAHDDASGARKNLDAAIEAYAHGFEREPTNYYPGINAVTLLWLRGDAEARKEAQRLAPRVREAVNAKLVDGREEYWALATALELAVIAGDWGDAETLAEKVRLQSTTPWMLESTIRQLEMLNSSLESGPGRERLESVIAGLHGESLLQENRDARP